MEKCVKPPTPTQQKIINILHAENKPMVINEIASAMQTHNYCIRSVMNTMRKLGFVTRECNVVDDHRYYKSRYKKNSWHLTPLGKKFSQKVQYEEKTS